jgi:hypothetical protein
LQTLVELGVDKNTTVVFPAPLMSTIGELGSFLAREESATVNARAGVDSSTTAPGQDEPPETDGGPTPADTPPAQ